MRVSKIFIDVGTMTNAEVYQGFHDDNKLKSTVLDEKAQPVSYIKF